MYACICHAVTESEVDAEIALGARSVKAIRKNTGAGASCGSCVKRLSCLLAAAKAPEPVGQLVREEPAVERQPRWKGLINHQPGCPAAVPALG